VTDIGEVARYLSAAPAVGFDFETAPDVAYRDEERAALDPHKAHVVGVSFSTAEDCGIYVPLAHRTGANADFGKMLTLLAEFAANPDVVKIAHNLAFESMFLYRLGIVPQAPVYDTIAAAQMTFLGDHGFRGLADSGLKTLVPEVFGEALPSFGEVTGGRHFDELSPADPETVRYACADSDYALRLYRYFNGWFAEHLPKHRHIVEQIESPTAVYCGLMKYNGVLADAALMDRKAAECEERLEKLRDEIAFIIGDAVKIGANCSTSAFKHHLYKELKLPVLKTTAKRQEAADDQAFEMLAEWCGTNRPELVPLFKLAQEYRRVGKAKSTYIEGYASRINSATGRIHADLMPLATETGRFASRNPNLQNMPRPGADDIGVRNFFAAPDGCVLLSLDFSQIELRVGAFYCRDEMMLETYRTNGDIHERTATVIYGHGKHDKEQRVISKNVNFGTFYGLFPKGLQSTLRFKAGLKVTLEQCEEVIANIKAGYPALAKWQGEAVKQAEKDRHAETWLGRRRKLPDINSSVWGKKSFAERCALNTPIQGTAADILKLALGRIIPGLPERPWLRPLLQVHDELVFEIPAGKAQEAAGFIKACMEARPFDDFDVPIIADAAVGARFGEMKELEAARC
jgi:DNA polymerase-1